MERLKISVAMATFNGIDFICEQLESIVRQTYAVDQVVISDDFSADGTYEYIEDFIIKHNLSNWVIEKNEYEHGVTSNFVNALKKCTGDIVFLCDQDDVWLENKVETIVSAFQKNSGLSCVISRIKYFEKEKIVERNTPFNRDDSHIVDLSELLSVCSYLGMSSAYKRDVVEKSSEEFMKKTSHDWALYITAEALGDIKYIGDVCQYYRIHANNTSIVTNGSFRDNRIQLLKRKLNHMIATETIVSDDKRKIVDDYRRFMKNRIEKIENKAFIKILLSLPGYRNRGYSIRNYVADFKAAITN